jgi:hypothetical protein
VAGAPGRAERYIWSSEVQQRIKEHLATAGRLLDACERRRLWLEQAQEEHQKRLSRWAELGILDRVSSRPPEPQVSWAEDEVGPPPTISLSEAEPPGADRNARQGRQEPALTCASYSRDGGT